MATIHVILLYAVITVLFSDQIAKRIPDSKTGFLGGVRKVFKFISAYTPNVE